MNNIVVFIDRDGTINEEVGYIDNFDKFRLLPGVAEAIRKLNQNDIPAIMITNQSGVARGYFTSDFLDALHKRMIGELQKSGCHLEAIYVCPHHPDDKCACRKPKPGLLLKAARKKGITLYRSYVIGDKIIDIRLAHSVRAKGILVLTGYGAEELRAAGGMPGYKDDEPDYIANNLYEAVDWILNRVAVSRSQGSGVTPTLSLPRYSIMGGGNKGGGKRILIVKPSSLGDIIHSLPVLWELRKIYPDSYIGWVVKEEWKDTLTGNPLIDKLVVLKKGIGGFLFAIRDIRKMKYDIILDLQGLFRSGIISALSGGHERIGFSNARELAYIFYNKKITPSHDFMHAVDRYMLTINAITGESNPPESPFTKGGMVGLGFPLYIEIEDAEWARDFLVKNNLYNVSPLIAINPSARWAKKRWPARSYADLINQLIHELKTGIIILGGKEDIPVAEEISPLVKVRPAVATGETSIKTLTALLERVDLLITSDSGPMHIAAALKKPVIALFGPTDPRLTGPYGDGHIVIRKGMDCSLCLRRRCVHGRPLCMEAITVEDVMKEVKKKAERG